MSITPVALRPPHGLQWRQVADYDLELVYHLTDRTARIGGEGRFHRACGAPALEWLEVGGIRICTECARRMRRPV